MATRIYHWKHGWIPLTHAAALSKAHGSHAGAARILGQMHPVPQSHLGRESHVMIGHAGTGSFAVLDKKSGHTAHLPDHEASAIHETGRRITGVDQHGKVTTTLGNDLTRADDSALETALGDLAAAGDYGPRFEAIAAEMDRRDHHQAAVDLPDQPDPIAEQEALRRLIFGLDSNRATASRKRDPERELRDDYDAWVYTQWLRAEQETRGHLLTKRAEHDGVDPRRLFTRDLRSLEAYASEELQRWFAEPGNHRMSFPEFRAGARDDARARAARKHHHGYESEHG